MPSITSWARLEPQCAGTDIEPGLAARIHDPLWLMARQWQLGEYLGEDTGTPIVARWRGQVAMLNRCHLGAAQPNTQIQTERYDGNRMPLETLVERQRIQPAASAAPSAEGLRLAVEGGQHFLRLLRAQPTAGGDYGEAFIAAYAVPALTAAQREGLDAPTLRYADLVAGRALDGRRLRAALQAGGGTPRIDPALGVQPGDLAEVTLACTTWLAWSSSLFSEPAPEAQAWQPERMEYAFSLATRLADDRFGERTLTAEQYADGTLDWYSFDLNLEVASGTSGDPPGALVTRTVIPAPVSFHGMPAARFWEFEDARIDLGRMQVGATDLPHMLMIDMLSGYANDWFVIPIELPVGSLAEGRSLVVTDTFGVKTLLRPNDDPQLFTPARWSVFQLAMRAGLDDPLGTPKSNLFFLPPSLVQPLESAPLEEVMLLRDEMANMAWAIERRIENALESGLDGAGDAIAAEPAVPDSPRAVPLYRLASAVPPHWIPLLPVRIGETSAEVRLARASLLDIGGTPRLVRAQGRLLTDDGAPGARLLIREEEVPREGVIVRRSYQAARWFDGRLHVWAGNRKTVGRGEGSSGLRFDALDV